MIESMWESEVVASFLFDAEDVVSPGNFGVKNDSEEFVLEAEVERRIILREWSLRTYT